MGGAELTFANSVCILITILRIFRYQFSLVTQSCPTLCYPMHCSTQGSPALHSHGSLKFMSIKSVKLSNHLILCCPLLLLPSIFPRTWVFSNELALCIRWPKYWSFSINLSNEYLGLISFWIACYDLLVVQGTLKSLLTTVQKHHFFGAQLSLWSNSHILT